ncbi:MAG: hypothetical protein AAFX06_31955 [Planctomycetota bacterium]
MKTWIFAFAIGAVSMLSGASAIGQEPVVRFATEPRLELEDGNQLVRSSSDVSVSNKWSAAELRQARAQLRARQRMMRMERNLWAGYEPLRPNWNSIPMMSSRFSTSYRTIVPIYLYSR